MSATKTWNWVQCYNVSKRQMKPKSSWLNVCHGTKWKKTLELWFVLQMCHQLSVFVLIVAWLNASVYSLPYVWWVIHVWPTPKLCRLPCHVDDQRRRQMPNICANWISAGSADTKSWTLVCMTHDCAGWNGPNDECDVMLMCTWWPKLMMIVDGTIMQCRNVIACANSDSWCKSADVWPSQMIRVYQMKLLSDHTSKTISWFEFQSHVPDSMDQFAGLHLIPSWFHVSMCVATMIRCECASWLVSLTIHCANVL